MIQVTEVKSKREQRRFLRFPIRLYKGNPYFVPPLYLDERKIFRKNYVYNDTCETIYFNAYSDGKHVGRISGIIQHAANEKYHQKRVRFTRFDCINDPEVAAALFQAVEDWAKSKGMDSVCGPLGFSDLEREGLLIDGFDYIATFEEQYNAPYYASLIESLGYRKEVDWNESRIRAPKDPAEIEKLRRTSDLILKRYKLHLAYADSTKEFIQKYASGMFELIDRSYDGIYGTVPFTKAMKDMMIENFRLIIDLRYVIIVLDEKDRPVCFGLCFPSIGDAVQKSNGRLTPAALLRLLKVKKNPSVIDMGLVGVDPDYINKGITVVVMAELAKMLSDPQIQYAETNLNLEYNAPIQNMWKRFDRQQHKLRRAYIKQL